MIGFCEFSRTRARREKINITRQWQMAFSKPQPLALPAFAAIISKQNTGAEVLVIN
jgi:hypothetical protein